MLRRIVSDNLEAYLQFLDGLRESGKTNMYGAIPYLLDEYPHLLRREAKSILEFWIASYNERRSEEYERTTD